LFGFICNITTNPKVKDAVARSLTIVTTLTGVLGRTTNSLVIERGLGLFVNCLTRPATPPTEDLLEALSAVLGRVANFATTTPTITSRAILLVYKLASVYPDFAMGIPGNLSVFAFLSKHFDTEFDNVIKTWILAAKNPAMADMVDVKRICDKIIPLVDAYLSENTKEELVANAFLLISTLVDHSPDIAPKFQCLITSMLRVAADRSGVVRKNAAITIARLAKSEENLEFIRETHGIEILASIVNHVT
jgi:hypothetical protein